MNAPGHEARDHAEPAERVLLIGASGHARVVLEALLDQPGRVVVGAVSADGLAIDGLGIEMLGPDDDLAATARSTSADAAFVAIGDNSTRQRVAAAWRADTGFDLAVAVSRFAMLSSTATVAAGAAVLPGAVVNAATSIGEGAIVNTNASVDHDCRIGAFVHVAPGVAIAGDVTVGERTFVGIGARVLPGVSIGADVMIGGGAVVTTDVPDGVTVVGVPARIVEGEHS